MIPRRWWPALAWAALILTLTSWPRLHVPMPQDGDKVAHLLAYIVLGILTARAAVIGAGSAGAWLATAAGLAAFGAVDEWHQAFIPGRFPSMVDWYADVAGSALGLLASGLSRRAARRPVEA